MKTRRSCRACLPDPVEEEKLSAILEAGTYAAAGMDIDPFYGAPELVVLANKDVPTYLYDGSLVMGSMMNAAAELGVASCWIHRAREAFTSEEGKQILKQLGIEGNYAGVGNLILGCTAKPAANAAPRKADSIYRI